MAELGSPFVDAKIAAFLKGGDYKTTYFMIQIECIKMSNASVEFVDSDFTQFDNSLSLYSRDLDISQGASESECSFSTEQVVSTSAS